MNPRTWLLLTVAAVPMVSVALPTAQADQAAAIKQEPAEIELSDLTPTELKRRADEASKRGDKAEAERIRSLVSDERGYLAQPGLTQAMRPGDWLTISELVAHSSNGRTRAGLPKLLERHLITQPRAVAGFDLAELQALLEAIERAGGAEPTAVLREELVLTWLGTPPTGQVSPWLRRALVAAIRGGATGGEALNAEAHKRSGELSRQDLAALVAANGRMGNAKEINRWASQALKTSSAAETKVGPAGLEYRARLLGAADAATADAEAGRLIGNLKALGEHSAEIPDSTYKTLARSLNTGRWRPKLEAAIADSKGEVNLAVAKTLAWCWKQDDKPRFFVGELGRKTADAQGDSLARWELARGYAVGLTGRGPRRRLATENIRLALAAAESNEMRLLVLRELAAAADDHESAAYAASLIESLQPQFEGEQAESIQAMLDSLASVAEANPKAVSDDSHPGTHEWRRRFHEERAGAILAHPSR